MNVLEHKNIYNAMFQFYDVECQYTPPRGRQEAIDHYNSDVTKVREFIEETRGLYHPDFQWVFNLPSLSTGKSPLPLRLPEIVDCWKGLDGNIYKCNYSIFIEDENKLRSLYNNNNNNNNSLLAEFILRYLYGNKNKTNLISTAVKKKYLKKFKYTYSHDATKNVCYMFLDDCISRWMDNRIRTLIKPDTMKLKEMAKVSIRNRLVIEQSTNK